MSLTLSALLPLSYVCVGHRIPSPSSRVSAVFARVDAVESTPNPSAFLLRLDAPPAGLVANGLRGQTFRRGSKACPASIAVVFETEGVDSVFAMESLITVSKKSSVGWDSVLPSVIAALGGASEQLEASGLPGSSPDEREESAAAAGSGSSNRGGGSIRLQVSQKLPIQVEASGWSGDIPPRRAKLSPRFASAMGLLVGQSGDAFFTGRQWLERGNRYPELDDGASAGGDVAAADGAAADVAAADVAASATGMSAAAATFEEVEWERLAIASALEEEVREVEAAYPDERLAAIVFGHTKGGSKVSAEREDALLSLEEVDSLCDEDGEAARAQSSGDEVGRPLQRLAAFVATGSGVLGARRNAIAYLGGTGGRGGDAAFEAIAAALKQEKAAGLRRTAGDALSDLGDGRAVPLAVRALGDRSSLVRWRAARILGEMGDGASTLAALKQASLEEGAFEVAFELRDAARKVKGRLSGEGGGGAALGPMWKQIQDGLQGK